MIIDIYRGHLAGKSNPQSAFYLPESVFYTQSIMLSPRFIPQSVYTQSVVRSPQFMFYTDRFRSFPGRCLPQCSFLSSFRSTESCFE